VIWILVVLNMIMMLLVQVIMHQLFQLVAVPQVPSHVPPHPCESHVRGLGFR